MDDTTGQGVLQGSSSACPIYILNSNVSLSAYQKTAVGASFAHPISGEITTDMAVQFVDDTLQFVNALGVSNHSDNPSVSDEELLQTAAHNTQLWANYLWVSGGNLNLSKCFHYAFCPYYNYKKSTTSYSKLRSGNHQICSLPLDDARRTLGVVMAPDGSGKTQLRVSNAKAKEFYGKSLNASMSPKAKWIAITTVIKPAILYPLVNTFFKEKDIKAIDSLTSRMNCLALGLNRNFPRAILHGPTLLGGIKVPSLSQKNTKDRINYFFYNIRRTSSLSKKFDVSIIYTQIEIGTFQRFFILPYAQYRHLATISYCVHLWQELELKGLVLKPATNVAWYPSLLSSQDISIME